MPINAYSKDTTYRTVTAFIGGVNSGLNPDLLEGTQLAFATNATVRGGFISHRPPYRQMTLDYGGDANLQALVELGFFNGGCAYRPDFGNTSLLAAITGKLFQFKISGNTASVSDVSVVGDPNPPTTGPWWLWQSENYVIGNDGVTLPLFFDGVSSRRSYGPERLLATGIAFAPANPPPIGDVVTVTLTAPYAGDFNIPVFFNGAIYQTLANPTATYSAILKNISATAGATINFPAEIYVKPATIGRVLAAPAPTVLTGGLVCVFEMSSTSGLAYQDIIIVTTANGLKRYRFLGAFLVPWNASGQRLGGPFLPDGSLNPLIGAGDLPTVGSTVVLESNTDPNVLVGITDANFVVPAIGGTVQISMDRAYSGPDNQTVWIGDQQFEISNVPPAPPNPTLYLINLTDTSAGAYVNPSPITSVPELPAGRMGAYSMGRNWMSLVDGISFIGSDIVGGDSGTPANKGRDAVLRITENSYLAGGGVFRLPGSGDVITAILATANLDASMGQGPVIICTARSIFSLNAPVDRTTWQSVTFPILSQSLLGSGSLSQNSTFAVNSDTFMRAIDGWRSYKIARRNFSEEWGNTPITREMERILKLEDQNLISYVSGIQFDNRALFTARPVASSGGFYSFNIVAMNLDPVSQLQSKSPPVYDGAWNGLNILQLMRAVIDNVDRCFAFVFNTGDTTSTPVVLPHIELWELLPNNPDVNRWDNDDPTDGRIEWSFETGVLFGDEPGRPLLQLMNGEIRVEDIVGQVDFHVQYKPDQYPCWTTWHKWSVCVEPATEASPDLKPAFQPRMGLGEPNPKDCDTYTERPMREGYDFQFRIAIKGHCRFLGLNVSAVKKPEVTFARPMACVPT